MIKKLKVSLLLLSVLGNVAWLSSAKAAFNGSLTVEVDGLKNKVGQTCISLFASSQGFPSDRNRVLQKQCTKIGDMPVIFTFEKLKAGSYAIAVIHDENGDRTLNRNSFGMPTEGFGFSRNPEVRTSAPKFSDAAFLLAGSTTSIKIELKYF